MSETIVRNASPMVADSRVRKPLGAGPQPAGTRAVVKPSRAASASRRSIPVTLRRSPARPTSPITTVVAGSGLVMNAEAIAIATARSEEGSVSRIPPTVDR